ncbi:MAG: RNA-binding cell elongation regulator Jag/EloR [Candidatus Binataceae bacterium]
MSPSDSIEVTASTIDEAIRQALERLGAQQDDAVIEVLSTPRAGVLGLGVRQARVRVTRRVPERARSDVQSPPPAPPRNAAGPPERRAPAPAALATTIAPPRPAHTIGTADAPQPSTRRNERPPSRGEEEAATPHAEAAEMGGEPDRLPADADEQAREATAALQRLLELMGETAQVERAEGEPGTLELNLKGDGSGILIGRHGQTLDALEYLLNRLIARKIKDALPIALDTESYRARRRRQLHRMALSKGEEAKREHITVTLDPMPPRDRRIVHLALKDDPMITTLSSGDGFLRSIEIVPAAHREQGSRERREREAGPERERDNESPLGQQGGFKHGQKRIV